MGLQGATYVCGVHNRILPKTHADVKTHYHSPASAARVASLHTIGPSLDTDGRRAVAEYILRSPFSLENLRYQASTGANIYQSRMHQVLKRNFAVFSACDWLAALTAHIPNAGEHLVRYYGWYSNVSRGKRRKTPEKGEESSTSEELSEVTDSVAKRAWARLIKQMYEVDPLVCPRCAGTMRIIAFMEQPAGIDLPVPRTADREDSPPPGPVAWPGA